MYHDLNNKGYTVKELSDNLTKLIEAGMGDRRVMIGPEGGEDGNEYMALPIVGLEANTDSQSSELDILWMYPGDNEWE